MIKTFQLILIILFFTSCQSKKQDFIDRNFIEKLANSVDENTPSRYFNYILFCPIDNNKIAQTNINSIFYIYDSKYKHDGNFNEFLNKVLNQNKKLKISDFDNLKIPTSTYKITKLDSNIMNKKTKSIMNLYFKIENGIYYFYPPDFKGDEIHTILYKMFLEGYKIQMNDYAGYYSLKK